MVTAEEPALAELEYLQATLRDLRTRHTNAMMASSGAQIALEHAQRMAADLSKEERYLRTRCQELECDIASRRRALKRAARAQRAARVRRILARFPSELLQIIFVEAMVWASQVWDRKDDQWITPFHSYAKAVAPFRVAAVDRQWRSLALRMPSLWEFIAIPVVFDDDHGAKLTDVSTGAISSILRMTPSLRELFLNFLAMGFDDGSSQPAAAPNLEVLGVDGDFDSHLPSLTALHMPRLREFWTVNIDAIEQLSPLLEHIAETVDKLVLCSLGPQDSLSDHEVHFIRKLKHLRHVVFRDCKHIDGDVPKVIYRGAAGLPHLESICFENPKMSDEPASVLSTWMLSLHADSAAGADGAVQFSLRAKSGAMPQWFMEQYLFMKDMDDGAALATAESEYSSDDSSEDDSDDEYGAM
ncbi:hypothetical protein AURDEDRAFT_160208 [Auricularia subglabra TFB-10046 SS5]|nr:hypothetical protein AURDEDRAFT_160208 [Auricularia subglabra TFB-10046 SS5]